MPSINDVYGATDLLKATDLPYGVPCPVTIESISPKQFDDGNKLEIRFVGKKKCFICNKTNARTIAAIYGENFEFWPGKQISIIHTFTDFQGEQVACIRVVPGTVAVPPQPVQQFAAPPVPQAPPQAAQQYAAPPQQAAPQGGPSADF